MHLVQKAAQGARGFDLNLKDEVADALELLGGDLVEVRLERLLPLLLLRIVGGDNRTLQGLELGELE